MPAPRERWWLRFGVAYFLLCQIQALSLIDRSLYGEWMGKPGDKLTQLIGISQIAIGLVLFYAGSRRWRSVRKGAALWLSLAAFLIFAATWSVNSGATTRAILQYVSLIVAAIGVAENLDADEFMDILAKVCFLAAVFSLLLTCRLARRRL